MEVKCKLKILKTNMLAVIKTWSILLYEQLNIDIFIPYNYM